jgi:hypothetical protein
MSMIFVSDLLDHPALIEIEATAVIPSGEVIAGQRTRS